MKKIVLLAVPLMFLAACAATGNGGTLAAAPTGGAQYCKKDRLGTEGDNLVCTWSPTISEACENTNLSAMKKSAVSSGPTNAGRCGNGAWLVSVQTK